MALIERKLRAPVSVVTNLAQMLDDAVRVRMAVRTQP
jgi:hypothetical protein